LVGVQLSALGRKAGITRRLFSPAVLKLLALALSELSFGMMGLGGLTGEPPPPELVAEVISANAVAEERV
jgi:hypothetical protein